MPPVRHLRPTALAALAATLAGCGITNPYAAPRPNSQLANRHTTTTETTITPRAGADADQSPRPGAASAAGKGSARGAVATKAAAPTPQAALERYATIYVNWTARSVASVQRRLAAISLSGARAQALQATATYQRDRTLLASKVANAGTVIAISGDRSTPGQWVIVTREQTTGIGDYTGLAPTLHVTYAQVTHTPNGWIVSEWAPQS